MRVYYNVWVNWQGMAHCINVISSPKYLEHLVYNGASTTKAHSFLRYHWHIFHPTSCSFTNASVGQSRNHCSKMWCTLDPPSSVKRYENGHRVHMLQLSVTCAGGIHFLSIPCSSSEHWFWQCAFLQIRADSIFAVSSVEARCLGSKKMA